MAFSLMFALPGTPVLWYGEEIGMGDDLSLPERNSVRTPMQWSDDANGGFSTAPAERLVRPVLHEGPFGYEKVNVADQHDRPGSMMEDIQRLVRARRSCPEVGWGKWRILDAGEPSVLVLHYDWRNERLVVLHNLADRSVDVRLDLDGKAARLVPLFCDGDDRRPRKARDPIPLGPYGFRWMRVVGEGARPGQETQGTGHA
jgi:maltose alpha-D-glucosyltransferase/alpha-amylase